MSFVAGEAVGRLAVGQENIGSTSTAILSVTAGTFTLTGNSVVFDPVEPVQVGTFTLTGSAATFQTQMPLVRATYTLTGNAAPLQVQLAAAKATFLLTGIDVVFDPNEAVQPGTFTLTGFAANLQTQLRTAVGTYALAGNAITTLVGFKIVDAGHFLFTGYDASYSYDYNLGGTMLQRRGPTFTRRRYEELLAEIEAEREAERRRQEELAEQARVAALAAITKARGEVLAGRAAQEARWRHEQLLRARTAAIASEQAMLGLHGAMQHANALTMAARHAHAQQLAHDQDDDEALMLLLGHME